MPETELFVKSFETTFKLTLEKVPPLKQKYLRYNNSPFMNRTLRKAIVTRSKLKMRYNLDGTTINFEDYKKQRNICSNLLCNIKSNSLTTLTLKM